MSIMPGSSFAHHRFLLVAFGLMLSVCSGAAWSEPQVCVVVGEEEPGCLRLAAAELADYAGRMLGQPVPVVNGMGEVSEVDRVLVIATGASPSHVSPALSPYLSPASLDELGNDGCLGVCVPPYLLLAGSTGRGAANAVWTYLEEYCHVGFFWSGDRVPDLEFLPCDEVDFRHTPRFAERYMSAPGAYSLAEYMRWEDWKREIDWRVHKRQNMMFGPEREFIWRRVYAELARAPVELSENERKLDGLRRRIAGYARDRGLMLVIPGFLGEVPAEFVAAHPDVRYVGGTRWGEVPMAKHIYPSDPMFHDLSVRFIRAYTSRYGPADYYFVPPYPEAIPEADEHVFGWELDEGVQKKSTIKRDLAVAIHKVIQDACPGAVWLTDSWAFMTSEYWTEDEVRVFCDAVVEPAQFRIYDTWGEERPTWPLHNAFWGKPWTLGVLHCFGGNSTLHGDLHALVRDVRHVATDPHTANCMGVYLVPESEHHNDLFFDLAMRLAWDPAGIRCSDACADLEDYLHDYAMRRYGPDSAAPLAEALGILARTVYASKDPSQPLYLHQLFTVCDFPNASVYIPPEQVARAPVLRNALELALREQRRQRGNPLYERDVVDMARRYLGDVFNGIVPEILHAWRAGDERRFRRAARDMTRCLDCVESVLWSSPQYRLETHFANVAGCDDYDARVRGTRNLISIWEGRSDLLDYVRRDDFAELVSGYYRPRIEAWLDRLGSVPSEDWSQEDVDWLRSTYWDIGKEWVEHGVSDRRMPGAGSTIRAVKRLLPKAHKLEQHGPKAAPGLLNLDFANGLDKWSLTMRRMDLAFGPNPDGPGRALRFATWPDSGGGNLYLFQTVQASAAAIAMDVRVDTCGESGFAGLRIEGYDADFRRVVECTYQWGDSWNHWPDRYRPDNVAPDWSVGATPFLWWWVGHYAIKQRFGVATGRWEHLEANPAADVDRVHGEGTWAGLGVTSLRIALVASTRRVEDPLAGAFRNLRVTLVRRD